MGAAGRTAEASAFSNGQCCRLCGAALKYSFVDLGMSPLCESFLAADQLDSMERFYPLRTQVCEHCFLVQLSEYVSPESIFSEYAYFSSYSTSWVAHAKVYCQMIKDRLDLNQSSLVVELASNDGYLLTHFLPLGIPVLGVEPAANVAKVAVDQGIPTRIGFFSARLAETLVIEGRGADLIVGNNVLAQVPDLNDFTEGMRRLLKPEGVITLEVPHLQRLIEGNQFDTIYHEHFSYFSFISLEKLAARHDLKLIDVEELSTHGGSLRVYLAHKGSNRRATKAVTDMRVREQDLGFRDLATYASFGDRVSLTKRKLLTFLIQAKDQGKKICGYGAPGKGNTLLNYCGVGRDFLDFTVDRNPYKHGRFTPGMHIPIYDLGAIDVARPDFVLILPWNLREEIVRQMQHVAEWGGKFVVPIPELEVIEPGN
jgi:SAM-dependent methyltransferase